MKKTVFMFLASVALTMTSCSEDEPDGSLSTDIKAEEITKDAPSRVMPDGPPTNIGGMNVSYDAQGRMTRFGNLQFAYSPNNNMIEIARSGYARVAGRSEESTQSYVQAFLGKSGYVEKLRLIEGEYSIPWSDNEDDPLNYEYLYVANLTYKDSYLVGIHAVDNDDWGPLKADLKLT